MATIRKLRNRWQAQIRRRGLVPRARSFDRRNDAVRWAREIETEADRSGWVHDSRRAEKMTLGDLLQRYLTEVTPSKRGAQVETIRLRRLAQREICFKTLAMLTSSDLARFRDERLAEVAPATVVRELNTVSHALDIAQKEWGIWLPHNPVKLLRRPKVSNARNRRLAPKEEQSLLMGCAATRTHWLRPLLVLALETAMRRSELVGLTWSNVDMVGCIAHLPHTKNGEPRDVPLSSRAMTGLRELAQISSSDRIFNASSNAVRLAWERLCARSAIHGLRFHDLRHEAVSRLFERGLSIAEVATITGHKDYKSLKRYTHLRAADLVSRLG